MLHTDAADMTVRQFVALLAKLDPTTFAAFARAVRAADKAARQN